MRRILINARAVGTNDAPTLLKIPDFGGGFRFQVNLVLTRTGITKLLSPWRVKPAVLSVIKDQQILIVRNGGGMLPDRRQAAGCYCERKFSERWKLVPLFRRITQDPLNSACFIIEAYEEIFAARNDQGVVRPVVRAAVDMKPIF